VEAAALALGMVCPDAFVYTHASSWQWPKKFTQTRSTFSEWNGGTRCKTSFRCLEHMRTPAYTLAMCSALVTDRNSAFGDRLACCPCLSASRIDSLYFLVFLSFCRMRPRQERVCGCAADAASCSQRR
jgi:hypothetical protein